MTTDYPETNEPNHEEIAPGVKLHWYVQQSILTLTIASVSQMTVDTCLEKTRQQIPLYDLDQPLRIVVLVSEYITVTGYLRQQMELFLNEYGTLFKGRCAFVIPKSPLRGILQIFAKRELASMCKNVQFDIFYDLENALTWVGEDF